MYLSNKHGVEDYSAVGLVLEFSCQVLERGCSLSMATRLGVKDCMHGMCWIVYCTTIRIKLAKVFPRSCSSLLQVGLLMCGCHSVEGCCKTSYKVESFEIILFIFLI